jgi:two-component system NtrC family sensor kinase
VFKSSLVKKTLLVAFALLVVQFLVIYFYILPLNREHNYKLMENHGKEVLHRVYEVIDDYYKEIVFHKKEMIYNKKEEIKKIVDLSIEVINSLYNASLNGKLSKEEAQKLAKEFVDSFRYKNNNYIWIVSKNNNLISHPMKKEIENGSVSLDEDEDKILKNIIYRAIRIKDGYYSYKWKRAGGSDKKDKTSYFKLFSEWDWIIGTGFYTDDIEREMESRKNALSQKIEKIIIETRIGRTGYIYIFNEEHQMLYHPNRYILGDRFKYLKNPDNDKTMAKSLEDAFYTPSKTLYYNWDHPEDQKNFIYKKVSWVSYHDGLKWYIGSSAYLEELNEGSGQIRTILLINSLFIGILLLIFMVYLFRSILLPISNMSQLTEKVINGDYSVKIDIDSNDEVGQLSKSFDLMILSARENIEKEKLIADEKLQVVTEMIGLIAHHWRQPLTVLSTSVYDIVETYEYDELTSEYLDETYEHVNNILQNMSEMIDQFRLIFQPEEEKDIFSVCDVIAKVIRSKIDKNSEIKFNINEKNIKFFKCTSSVDLNGYIKEFEKLFYVFVENSVDAVSDKDTKYIRVNIVDDIDFIKISIEDSGGGIPEDSKDKIFQPYFTTKHQAFGTGLGLYMAKMVIEMNMKGKLSVSNGEKGAKFLIELRKN